MQLYKNPVRLGRDEVLLGRTVNKETGVQLALAQARARACAGARKAVGTPDAPVARGRPPAPLRSRALRAAADVEQALPHHPRRRDGAAGGPARRCGARTVPGLRPSLGRRVTRGAGPPKRRRLLPRSAAGRARTQPAPRACGPAETPCARAQQAAGAPSSPPLAFVVDTSTNGTFLNTQKLERGTKVQLHDGDLLCFASPDLAFEKARRELSVARWPAAPRADVRAPQTVAFYFHAYDDAKFGPQHDAPAEAPSAKRLRAAHAAAAADMNIAAVDLHGANQELRQRNTDLAAQLAAATSAAAADAAAAKASLAELQDALAAARRAARDDAETVAQAAAAERAKAEARAAEATAAVGAEKARAAAAAAAASEADADAVAARAERDAAHARAREAEAALDAARAKLEGMQDAQRAALRTERDAATALREELSARDAALTAERAEKAAALRRAELAAEDAAAAAQQQQAEREQRLLAEAAAAKAAEGVAEMEAQLARLREESRGVREGGALDLVFLEQIARMVRTTHENAAAVLPHMDALMHKARAQTRVCEDAGGSDACVRPSAAAAPAASEPERATQHVPQPPGMAPAAAHVVETQTVGEDAGAPAPGMCAALPVSRDAPPTMLHGSMGLAPFSEPEEAPAAQHVLPPVDEGDMGECNAGVAAYAEDGKVRASSPSPSVQEQIDMAAADMADAAQACAFGHLADNSSQQRRNALAAAAAGWPM